MSDNGERKVAWGTRLLGGEENVARIRDAVPEGVRDAGKALIHGYVDWATKPRTAPSVGVTDAQAQDMVGKVANGAARVAGQPQDYWAEHHGEAKQYWDAQDDKEGAPVQMKEVDVEGVAPIDKPTVSDEFLRHHAERVGLGSTQMKQLAAGLPEPEPTQLRPHDKPMTHEQLMAKARSLLDERAANLENPALAERDERGGMLPHWLTNYMKNGGQ